jgi:membrane protease YdiL (CAAX protease family)
MTARVDRDLILFAGIALAVGGGLLTLSTIAQPEAPFLLAAVLFGLALPALVLTWRRAGAAAVRALLRDCVRLPTKWWFLLVAGFAIPSLTWAIGAALGGAVSPSWSMAGAYVADLLIGAAVINIWEELAWAGFFQRHAVARWGLIGGSLVTAVLFAGIHVPLAVADASASSPAIENLLYLLVVAVGIRLLIAQVDLWSGRSLLVIGILHSSFNATEAVLAPEYFWVRLAVTAGLGLSAVAYGHRASRSAADRPPRTTERDDTMAPSESA